MKINKEEFMQKLNTKADFIFPLGKSVTTDTINCIKEQDIESSKYRNSLTGMQQHTAFITGALFAYHLLYTE